MLLFRYILVFALLVYSRGTAQPDFAKKHLINDVLLYQDNKIRNLFYYAPYGLELVKDKNEKPDFKFLQMRYTGTRLSKDQGSHRFKSLLRFKVANRVPSAIEKDSIKNILLKKGIRIVKLQPLPIHNIKATLIHSTVNDSIAKSYSSGFFENRETHPAGAYWTERDFILRLGNEDAQIFHAMLQGNQPTLSINYTYLAKGLDNTENELIVSGSEEFTEDMKANFDQEKDSVARVPIEKVIISGALSVTINTKKWPDLIKQIDINEHIPPEYAALDVYCYDFNNEIRKDLYAKMVDIKATGVGRKEVQFRTTFKSREPDIYAQTIKFIYAVRPDKSYTYRITEIRNNGRRQRSGWKTVRNWHQILDISSQNQNKINK